MKIVVAEALAEQALPLFEAYSVANERLAAQRVMIQCASLAMRDIGESVTFDRRRNDCGSL
jgi:hypothetical protein